MIACPDSFALLTWLKNEPGTATVDALLNQSATSPDDRCHVALPNASAIQLAMELQAPLATGDHEIVAVHAHLGLTLIQIP